MSADRPAPPAVVQARVTARWDAALELIRAGDCLRELAGVSGEVERQRYDTALRAWDRLTGGAPR